MSNLREAAQQAMLAWNTVCNAQGWDPMHLEQFVRLRAALAQADDKVQPPVKRGLGRAETELSFEQIEDCFPDGATSTQNGSINVSAQWLHDFARSIIAADRAARGGVV